MVPLLITLSIVEMAIWPLCFHYARGNKIFLRVLDYSVIISLFALLFIFVIPEIYRELGLSIIVPFFLGLLIPIAIEHFSSHYRSPAESIFFLMILLGISFHAIFDGIALTFADISVGHGHELPIAVLLHRLPVALIIWRIFATSKIYAIFTYVGIAVGTLIGAAFGPYLSSLVNLEQTTYIQAFVSGFLLHIAIDVLKQQTHPHSHHH